MRHGAVQSNGGVAPHPSGNRGGAAAAPGADRANGAPAVHAFEVPLAPNTHLARFRLDGVECVVVAHDDDQSKSAAVLGTFTVGGQCYAVLRRGEPVPGPDLVNVLTPREMEIAVLVAGGCETKAIARRLRISFHTVRVHLARTYAKLGLHKQTELAARIAARFP